MAQRKPKKSTQRAKAIRSLRYLLWNFSTWIISRSPRRGPRAIYYRVLLSLEDTTRIIWDSTLAECPQEEAWHEMSFQTKVYSQKLTLSWISHANKNAKSLFRSPTEFLRSFKTRWFTPTAKIATKCSGYFTSRSEFMDLTTNYCRTILIF